VNVSGGAAFDPDADAGGAAGAAAVEVPFAPAVAVAVADGARTGMASYMWCFDNNMLSSSKSQIVCKDINSINQSNHL
jgi:hypothetical protein